MLYWMDTTRRIILTTLILIFIHNVEIIKSEQFRKRKMFPKLNEVSDHNTNGANKEHVNQTQADALLEETKMNLIKEFGLRKRMLKIGSKLRKRQPHKFMKYLIKNFRKLQPSVANTVRGCTDLGEQRKRIVSFPHISFKFDVSELPEDELTVLTHLRVLMKMPKNVKPLDNGYKLTLFGVFPRQKKEHGRHKEPKLFELSSKVVKFVAGEKIRWITFDATAFFLIVKDLKKKYVKFVLRAQSVHGGSLINPSLIGLNTQHIEETNKALLVLYSGKFDATPARSTRTKRAAPSSPQAQKKSDKRKRKKEKRSRKNKNRKNRKNRKACRRKNMEVDFSHFGWTNWLFHPAKYNAYYCHGQCQYPLPDHLKATNHAIIQSIVHNMDKQIVPQACCVPDEFEVLAFLLLDGSDRVVFKIKEGLIVKSCSCI